jgi:membrane protein YqaA with SNARE-associated domain
MNVFSILLAKMMIWAEHRHAQRYLAGVSFTESAFFPIPPDVIMIPMILARPDRAWALAWLTTWTSVLGSLLGYAIGFLAIDLLMPYIQSLGYEAVYQQAKTFVADYGVWALLIGSFTPIPFKVFTITAGATDMALLPFVLIAMLGRAKRFFLVAAVAKYGGVRALPMMQKYADAMGWLMIGLLLVGWLVWSWRSAGVTLA